jgi:soluble lytic murein transglycosylase-like protein
MKEFNFMNRKAIALACFMTICSSIGWGSDKPKSLSIKEVIAEQETQKGIPQDLLRAIGKIESGLSPWAVNADGRAHMFKTKAAAAKYIKELVEDGTTNFSVGCMQLHYASHRRHFKSVEAMLEPQNNIAHAAKLIKNLERRFGSMERAVKLYHSPSPTHQNRYKNRVYGMWAKIRGPKQAKLNVIKNVALKQESPKGWSSTKTPQHSKIKFGVGSASKKTN